MKVRILCTSILMFFAGALLVLPQSQGGGKKKSEAPPSAQAGKEHKQLRAMVGNWKAAGKMYGEPGKPATPFAGSTKRNMILSGFFLQEKYTGDFFGQKFQGLGIMGYDSINKKYEHIWLDSMTSAMFRSEGKFDPASRTYTFVGTAYDPKTEKPVKMKTVIKIVSKNEHIFSMYGLMTGDKNVKMMEITYTRASGSKKKK